MKTNVCSWVGPLPRGLSEVSVANWILPCISQGREVYICDIRYDLTSLFYRWCTNGKSSVWKPMEETAMYCSPESKSSASTPVAGDLWLVAELSITPGRGISYTLLSMICVLWVGPVIPQVGDSASA